MHIRHAICLSLNNCLVFDMAVTYHETVSVLPEYFDRLARPSSAVCRHYQGHVIEAREGLGSSSATFRLSASFLRWFYRFFDFLLTTSPRAWSSIPTSFVEHWCSVFRLRSLVSDGDWRQDGYSCADAVSSM